MSEINRYTVHVSYHKPEEMKIEVFASNDIDAQNIGRIIAREKIRSDNVITLVEASSYSSMDSTSATPILER